MQNYIENVKFYNSVYHRNVKQHFGKGCIMQCFYCACTENYLLSVSQSLFPPCHGEINPNDDLWLNSAATDYSYHTSLVLFRFSHQLLLIVNLHSTPLMAPCLLT